jgi:O-methyltransferase
MDKNRYYDMDSEFFPLWEQVEPFTMTSIERGYSLYTAVEYLVRSGIGGDFIECGVWKGGSCMLMALTLLKNRTSDRTLFLFDTFSGMTTPSEFDLIAHNRRPVAEKWDSFSSWAAGVAEVKQNLTVTGYPPAQLQFVQGDVAETLCEHAPPKAALIRLDTDWYESTKIELELLYPRLVPGGVIIIDDYGHFTGARKAVDEYFETAVHPVLFHRVDYTGRTAVKPGIIV